MNNGGYHPRFALGMFHLPLRKAAAFWGINALLRKEIGQKDGLPLGNYPVRPLPLYAESRS